MEVLFFNHTAEKCGVYQYGLRVFEILSQDSNILYRYVGVDNLTTYQETLKRYPSVTGIIYNYHLATMPWLNSGNIQRSVIKNIAILHECDNPMFDIICNIDPSIPSTESSFSLPRPIYDNIEELLSNYTPSTKAVDQFISFNTGVPIFGSFGFGFDFKGFHKIVDLVNNNFDEAIIKFVMPESHFDGNKNTTNANMVKKCQALNKKPGIKLLITHDFFTTKDILNFLQSNSMNLFLYDRLNGRGISSVIDMALSAKKPIGISDSYMFRNIYSEKIDVYKTNVKDCMKNSLEHCSQFLKTYSNANMINTFKSILFKHLPTYSQILQDNFSLNMTQYKKNGYFLEIGSNHPTTHSNSYLMEKYYNWKGLMIEYDGGFESSYKAMRPNSHYHIGDARTAPYYDLLKKYSFPKEIDYLQIDLDVDNRSTLDTLELLHRTVLNEYRFATITFEHDIYRGDFFETRQKSREIFISRGYHLLFADVSVFFEGRECQFEDWYIHPSLVYIPNLQTEQYIGLKRHEIKEKLLSFFFQNRNVKEIEIAVSIGEIFDKLSILDIKNKKITDPTKLLHVKKEITKILPKINHLIEKNKTLYQYLLTINEIIWDLMDHTKNISLTSEDFSNLSFQIYHSNDARFRIKSLIDKQNSSLISEVKSYKKERVIFIGHEKLHSQVKEIYQTFLSFYFDIVIYQTNLEVKEEGYIYNLLSPDISPKFSHLYNSPLLKQIEQNLNVSENVSYLHSGALGDLIHCLYVIKVKYLLTGKRGNLYLKNGFFTRDVSQTYSDIKNIIEKQEYISQVCLYNNEHIDINLDIFRSSPSLYHIDWLTNLSQVFNIPLISMSWMKSFRSFKSNNKILINRSRNRQIANFPWEAIVKKNKCAYVTFNVDDYNAFPYKEDVELIKVENFSEMIEIIGNCKFFIGNQSAPLALSYALGKPCFGELYEPDAKLYTGLDKYNDFIWISNNNSNLNSSILNKYSISI